MLLFRKIRLPPSSRTPGTCGKSRFLYKPRVDCCNYFASTVIRWWLKGVLCTAKFFFCGTQHPLVVGRRIMSMHSNQNVVKLFIQLSHPPSTALSVSRPDDRFHSRRHGDLARSFSLTRQFNDSSSKDRRPFFKVARREMNKIVSVVLRPDDKMYNYEFFLGNGITGERRNINGSVKGNQRMKLASLPDEVFGKTLLKLSLVFLYL